MKEVITSSQFAELKKVYPEAELSQKFTTLAGLLDQLPSTVIDDCGEYNLMMKKLNNGNWEVSYCDDWSDYYPMVKIYEREELFDAVLSLFMEIKELEKKHQL